MKEGKKKIKQGNKKGRNNNKNQPPQKKILCNVMENHQELEHSN